MIRAVVAVVPARDEERLIGACLRAIGQAARHRDLAGLPVAVVVAADSCRDRTAAVARRHGAHPVQVDATSAGASRAVGTAAALDLLRRAHGDLADEEIWLAHTDADTRVPPCWLAHQLGSAAQGYDAVVGTVTVEDWSAHPPGARARFLQHYQAYRGHGGEPPLEHPHVHGANLAVRASAYLAVGGFAAVPVGEDRALLTALEAAGRRVLRSDTCPVVTSARRDARAPGGFGDFLTRLRPLDVPR